MNTTISDPHSVLGLKPGATPEQVRSAYLQLVCEYPPERDADKFREIHSAYEMLNDPLVQAAAMLKRRQDRPDLGAIVDRAQQTRARLPKLTLLALGN